MVNKILYDTRIHIPVLSLITIFIYFQVLSFSLTGSDDITLLNSLNPSGVAGKSIYKIINSPYMFDDGLFYRPVVSATFYFNMFVSDNLMAHFAVNIIIHLVNVLLLYYLLLNLKTGKAQSFLFSLVFAVHPVLVNSVSWLPGRNDSLLFLFLSGSLIFLIKYINKKSILLISLHLLFLLLALFTKETAVLAVPLFVLFMYLYSDIRERKIKINLILSWFITIAVWWIARISAVKESAEFDLTGNISFIIQSAGKILMPVNLSVLPVINDTSYLYGLFSIALLVLLYFYTPGKNKKKYIFGIIFFLIFLIPALINKNPEYSANIMLESRLYLPVLGILISFSQIEFINKEKISNLTLVVFVFITGLFAYNTFTYSRNYKNDVVFWNNAIENSPSLDLAFSGLALINLQKENFETAVINYKKAIDLNQGKGEYYLKTAYCYTRLNKIDAAEDSYRKALDFFPNDHDANLLLGIICFKKDNYSDAEKYLVKASKTNSVDMQPDIYLMKLYFNSGFFTKAKVHADRLKDNNVKLPPDIEKKLYAF